MKKYEYRVITIMKKDEEKERLLNELGQQGWELVCVYSTVHYMKRTIE